MIVHARHDERGKLKYGKKGDQTGGEVKITPWIYFKQNVVLRPIDKSIGNKMVEAGKWLARSNFVGYDQANRLTLFKELEKIDFDYTRLKKKCECDCSAFINCLANIAGISVDENLRTKNMKAPYLKTKKFKALTARKYLKSDKWLRKGDIVLAEGRHVVLVCTDGEKVQKRYNRRLIGKYMVTSKNLNLRTGAGLKYTIKKKLHKNDVVICTGYYFPKWYQVSSGTMKGWVRKKYLKRIYQ